MPEVNDLRLEDTILALYEIYEAASVSPDQAVFSGAYATFHCRDGEAIEPKELPSRLVWASNLFSDLPDGRYAIMAFAMEEKTQRAVASVYAFYAKSINGFDAPNAVFVLMLQGTNPCRVLRLAQDDYRLSYLGWN